MTRRSPLTGSRPTVPGSSTSIERRTARATPTYRKWRWRGTSLDLTASRPAPISEWETTATTLWTAVSGDRSPAETFSGDLSYSTGPTRPSPTLTSGTDRLPRSGSSPAWRFISSPARDGTGCSGSSADDRDHRPPRPIHGLFAPIASARVRPGRSRGGRARPFRAHVSAAGLRRSESLDGEDRPRRRPSHREQVHLRAARVAGSRTTFPLPPGTPRRYHRVQVPGRPEAGFRQAGRGASLGHGGNPRQDRLRQRPAPERAARAPFGPARLA